MENKKFEHLDPMEKLFKERLEQHEMPVPGGLWEALDAKLDKEFPQGGKPSSFWGQTWVFFVLGGICIATIGYLAYAPAKVDVIKETRKESIEITPRTVVFPAEKEILVPIGEKNISEKRQEPKKELKKPLKGTGAYPQISTPVPTKEESKENASVVEPGTSQEPISPPSAPMEKEEEPASLYERLKKENKEKENRSLFIEEKK